MCVCVCLCVCMCILACISVHDLKVDVTRYPTPTFTVRKILTSLLANTVRVFTAMYRIERAIDMIPLCSLKLLLEKMRLPCRSRKQRKLTAKLK